MKIPRQMDAGTAARVEAMGDAAKGAVMAVSSSSIVLSILFAGLLQYLWGLINTL